MQDYSSIERIFGDIQLLITDYVKWYQVVDAKTMMIRLDGDEFYFPATLTEFSHRAKELQYRLQRQAAILAQKRRHEISRGMSSENQPALIDQRNRFDEEFKARLRELQTNASDGNIRRLEVIIDALEIYDEIQRKKSPLNNTFRLIGVVKYIGKQLCCISRSLQKMLDDHSSIIEAHLRRLQGKFSSYDKDMRKKLAEYISRDIRPPVLVIPCPTRTPSPNIFSFGLPS